MQFLNNHFLHETYKVLSSLNLTDQAANTVMLDLYTILDRLNRSDEIRWENNLFELAKGEVFRDIINVCKPRRKIPLFSSLSSLFLLAAYFIWPSGWVRRWMEVGLISMSILSWVCVIYEYTISGMEHLRI